jgi:RNA polymerase sigma-70 factor (ECF subfamily)
MNDTDVMLRQIAAGKTEAVNALLERQRPRLKKMVLCRMDGRLAPRIDPSDIVQETLIVAARDLQEFARTRPIPFYPWLRRLAQQRLIEQQRQHLAATRRSLLQEETQAALTAHSVQSLAKRLLSREPGPDAALQQSEEHAQIKAALLKLEAGQRELLLLHYVEGLKLSEAAEVLGIQPQAARMRHLRAIQKLRGYLE